MAGLVTVWEPASWCNLDGNVDRSACFEITAKEAMGLERVEQVDAANGIGRLWTRTMVLGTAQLELLRRQRRPRRLRGDYRWRTPSMAPEGFGPGVLWDRVETRFDFRGRRQLKALRKFRPDGPDHLCIPNPNRGATATKVLGLEGD